MSKIYTGTAKDGREISLFHDPSSRLPYVVTVKHPGIQYSYPVISCSELREGYHEYNAAFNS